MKMRLYSGLYKGLLAMSENNYGNKNIDGGLLKERHKNS
jgi:hypothetical protein